MWQGVSSCFCLFFLFVLIDQFCSVSAVSSFLTFFFFIIVFYNPQKVSLLPLRWLSNKRSVTPLYSTNKNDYFKKEALNMQN